MCQEKELLTLEKQIVEKRAILDDLDQQIRHHQFELEYVRKRLRTLKGTELQYRRKMESWEGFLEATKHGFAPVPPPLLSADQIPNKSGVYFIWQGPLVAYVGQSNNLARRLFKHEQLRHGDKISYLCIDSSELFYHEAFYIGLCRPSRNGTRKASNLYNRVAQDAGLLSDTTFSSAP